MNNDTRLLLGLIGDNISRSRSPLLQRLAGKQNGIAVQYDRLIPPEQNKSFEDVFASCVTSGYRGINVTYPYKETVAALVRIDDPLVRTMAAVNTVIFEPGGPRGYNTDYTGFMSAYRLVRGNIGPGSVLMIGAGGVGRAVAFGLARLGTTELRLVDRDAAKADSLADALHTIAPDMAVSIWQEPETAAAGAAGLVNCTPIGMIGHEGTVLQPTAMPGAAWAFDAVYTPANTRFLLDAAAAGLSVISGWELFFFQGVNAWNLFSGTDVDESGLRRELTEQSDAA